MSVSKTVVDFLEFVNSSPTPYHAVRSAIARLEEAGFAKIHERDPWAGAVHPGGRYYLTRNGSSVVAFVVGRKWRPGGPAAIVGAHTDSPCLRLKPASRRFAAGFAQVGVETYGGGIWHTWFDRDLSVAGRALVRDPASGNFVQRLVALGKPLLRIPTLAIHLDRSTEFNPNKESHLFPIAGLVAAELNKGVAGGPKESEEEEKNGQQGAGGDDARVEGGETNIDDAGAQKQAGNRQQDAPAPFAPLSAMAERHHPQILDLIAANLGVEAGDVVDFELVLHDTQPACVGGLNDEFIFSPRLDNLCMTYCAVAGLVGSVAGADGASSLDDDACVRMSACFDHEEVGSVSAQGAASSLLADVLHRIASLPSPSDPQRLRKQQQQQQQQQREVNREHVSDFPTLYSPSAAAFEQPLCRVGHPSSSSSSSSSSSPASTSVGDPTLFEQMMSRSFLLSADMAHSVHPNYQAKYEPSHRPAMNAGPVIKVNANQRYATDSPGIVLLQECARLAGVPLQLFVVRNDSSCGSTIGPMLSARLGVRTLDLGNPQLSMHSIRETGGSRDVDHGVRLFEQFFRGYSQLEPRIRVDE